ncbi:MAG: 3-oxoacyl-[acyl-carrier protein] reductase [Cyclobacteriaceae bacterium]|jgi:3-oxoacyl-[acyl-carrier protein] reductase
MEISLKGHHALVCGSSQGIGAAIVMQMAKSGAKVTLVARNESRLLQILSELKGDGHKIFVADFDNAENVSALIEYISECHPDILINNSGGPSPGPIISANISDFEKAINRHLMVSHQLAMACLPAMKSSNFGRIINIISTSVKIPIDGLGVSNTTRGAMASWAKSLSNEVAQFGITVNNILPGLTETERLNMLVAKLANDVLMNEEEMISSLKHSIPARRFGLPEEMAYTATFLASHFAAYVNGESIRVDGGRTGSI